MANNTSFVTLTHNYNDTEAMTLSLNLLNPQENIYYFTRHPRTGSYLTSNSRLKHVSVFYFEKCERMRKVLLWSACQRSRCVAWRDRLMIVNQIMRPWITANTLNGVILERCIESTSVIRCCCCCCFLHRAKMTTTTTYQGMEPGSKSSSR